MAGTGKTIAGTINYPEQPKTALTLEEEMELARKKRIELLMKAQKDAENIVNNGGPSFGQTLFGVDNPPIEQKPEQQVQPKPLSPEELQDQKWQKLVNKIQAETAKRTK